MKRIILNYANGTYKIYCRIETVWKEMNRCLHIFGENPMFIAYFNRHIFLFMLRCTQIGQKKMHVQMRNCGLLESTLVVFVCCYCVDNVDDEAILPLQMLLHLCVCVCAKCINEIYLSNWKYSEYTEQRNPPIHEWKLCTNQIKETMQTNYVTI